jgi:hypothetical protein
VIKALVERVFGTPLSKPVRAAIWKRLAATLVRERLGQLGGCLAEEKFNLRRNVATARYSM